MSNLRCPTRSSYNAELLIGTKISGTVTIGEKSINIAPVKSATDYDLTEATAVAGSFLAFPTASSS